MSDTKDWTFSHDLATDAKWTPGLREIFEYRDLAIKDATKGDYVAHLIRHNGKKAKDEVQQWHVHDCTFQMVYVMNGWATFEYADQGVKTIRKGDCINQRPGIRASRDRLLRGFRGARDRVAGELQDQDRRGAGGAGPGRGVAFGSQRSSRRKNNRPANRRVSQGGKAHVRTVPPVATGHAQSRSRGRRHRGVARHPASRRQGRERPDQDRPAAGADRRAGHGRPAAEARRRVLRQAAERQGRHPGTADRAPDRGHRRQSRQLRAQGAGDGGAPRLPPADRHHAVVGGPGGGAQARRMGLDLHLVRQRRRPADRREPGAELLPRQHLGTDGHACGVALPARHQDAEVLRAGARLRLGPQQRAGLRAGGAQVQEGIHRQGLRADRHQGLFALHHQDSPVRRRRRLPGDCRATTTTRSCPRRSSTACPRRSSC